MLGPLRIFSKGPYLFTCLQLTPQEVSCEREREGGKMVPSSKPSHAPASRITVVTWNVGTAMPPDDVTSLLHLSGGHDGDGADMIAIG